MGPGAEEVVRRLPSLGPSGLISRHFADGSALKSVVEDFVQTVCESQGV